MHKLTQLGWLIVLSAFAVTGCGNATPTTPTSFSSSSIPVLSISPSTLVAQSVNGFACPALPPFEVPFELLISTSDAGFVITNITARFVTANGASMPPVTLAAPMPAPMPPVTLPAPAPTTPIGSITMSANSQALPLSLGIGCGTGHTGNLTLLVVTLDGQGHTGSTQLTATVR